MKRFNFKLEKVLRLREHREQEVKLELGKAVSVLSGLERQIKNVAAEKIAASQNRFAHGMNFTELRSADLFMLRLDQTKDALLQAAAESELEVEKIRERYLEASSERKVLSNLKERREREYRRAMNLEEIKAVDDITGGIAARKVAG